MNGCIHVSAMFVYIYVSHVCTFMSSMFVHSCQPFCSQQCLPCLLPFMSTVSLLFNIVACWTCCSVFCLLFNSKWTLFTLCCVMCRTLNWCFKCKLSLKYHLYVYISALLFCVLSIIQSIVDILCFGVHKLQNTQLSTHMWT